MAFCMNHMVACCRCAERLPRAAPTIGLQRLVAGVLLAEGADLVEEGHHGAAAVLAAACGRRGRAPGCRWRPRRSWRCGRRARTAPCPIRRCSRGRRTPAAPSTALSKPHVGEHALDDRRHQAEMVVGGLARLVVRRAVGDVGSAARSRAPARAPASLKARIVSSMRRTSGWTMIGSAGLSGAFGAGQRAALQPLPGIGGGVLVGDLGLARAPACRRRAAPRSSSRTWR